MICQFHELFNIIFSGFLQFGPTGEQAEGTRLVAAGKIMISSVADHHVIRTQASVRKKNCEIILCILVTLHLLQKYYVPCFAKCVDKTKFETVLLSSILKQQIVKQITDRKIDITKKKKDEKVRIHARVASA